MMTVSMPLLIKSSNYYAFLLSGATVQFTSSDYSVSESAGAVNVTASLSVVTEIEVIVELIKMSGTASSK